VVRHPLDHEPMDALTCPSIAGPKRLKHEKRDSQLIGPSEGPIEREIPGRTA
jgi:hypothetical protein